MHREKPFASLYKGASKWKRVLVLSVLLIFFVLFLLILRSSNNLNFSKLYYIISLLLVFYLTFEIHLNSKIAKNEL